jgi:predicted TIM-barrel fold metal-dependent hydrolase
VAAERQAAHYSLPVDADQRNAQPRSGRSARTTVRDYQLVAADGQSAHYSSPDLTRRDVLKLALTATGIAALPYPALSEGAPATPDLIDVNVTLSRWPLRRLRFDDTPSLVALLRSHGVRQAWAASFEALLHKDLAAANARLADECRRHGRGLLLPFGSVNPKSPDWQEDLRRCADLHRIPGLRLYPNYHGYDLTDPDFAQLLKLAAEHRVLVQIALLMEDERMMHPRLRVPPVGLAPLAALVGRTPGLRLVLLNALGQLKDQPLRDLLSAGEVYVEISMLEGVGGIANLLSDVPLNRVLFGSHAPLFYFESALLKLHESPLTHEQSHAIQRGNAATLIA